MDYKDYYAALGVSRDAGSDEIKRAYRKLARKYHPDVNAGPEADTKFKEAGEAYEVLGDPEKRAAYDQLGKAEPGGFQPPPDWGQGYSFSEGSFDDSQFGGGQFGDGQFSDFFETLFRRGQASGSTHGAARGGDMHARLMLDIGDVFTGAKRVLDLGRRSIQVTIPKGISEGQHIRLAGKGAPGLQGAPAGDLFLEVAFAPHPVFRIDGRDLHMTLPVTPWEAALGGKVAMPTPGGKVEIKVPKNARAGQKLRLKGRGLPGPPSGDLFAAIQIVNPPVKTEEGEAFFRKMAREMSFDPREKLGKTGS